MGNRNNADSTDQRKRGSSRRSSDRVIIGRGMSTSTRTTRTPATVIDADSFDWLDWCCFRLLECCIISKRQGPNTVHDHEVHEEPDVTEGQENAICWRSTVLWFYSGLCCVDSTTGRVDRFRGKTQRIPRSYELDRDGRPIPFEKCTAKRCFYDFFSLFCGGYCGCLLRTFCCCFRGLWVWPFGHERCCCFCEWHWLVRTRTRASTPRYGSLFDHEKERGDKRSCCSAAVVGAPIVIQTEQEEQKVVGATISLVKDFRTTTAQRKTRLRRRNGKKAREDAFFADHDLERGGGGGSRSESESARPRGILEEHPALAAPSTSGSSYKDDPYDSVDVPGAAQGGDGSDAGSLAEADTSASDIFESEDEDDEMKTSLIASGGVVEDEDDAGGRLIYKKTMEKQPAMDISTSEQRYYCWTRVHTLVFASIVLFFALLINFFLAHSDFVGSYAALAKQERHFQDEHLTAGLFWAENVSLAITYVYLGSPGVIRGRTTGSSAGGTAAEGGGRGEPQREHDAVEARLQLDEDKNDNERRADRSPKDDPNDGSGEDTSSRHSDFGVIKNSDDFLFGSPWVDSAGRFLASRFLAVFVLPPACLLSALNNIPAYLFYYLSPENENTALAEEHGSLLNTCKKSTTCRVFFLRDLELVVRQDDEEIESGEVGITTSPEQVEAGAGGRDEEPRWFEDRRGVEAVLRERQRTETGFLLHEDLAEIVKGRRQEQDSESIDDLRAGEIRGKNLLQLEADCCSASAWRWTRASYAERALKSGEGGRRGKKQNIFRRNFDVHCPRPLRNEIAGKIPEVVTLEELRRQERTRDGALAHREQVVFSSAASSAGDENDPENTNDQHYRLLTQPEPHFPLGRSYSATEPHLTSSRLREVTKLCHDELLQFVNRPMMRGTRSGQRSADVVKDVSDVLYAEPYPSVALTPSSLPSRMRKLLAERKLLYMLHFLLGIVVSPLLGWFVPDVIAFSFLPQTPAKGEQHSSFSPDQGLLPYDRGFFRFSPGRRPFHGMQLVAPYGGYSYAVGVDIRYPHSLREVQDLVRAADASRGRIGIAIAGAGMSQGEQILPTGQNNVYQKAERTILLDLGRHMNRGCLGVDVKKNLCIAQAGARWRDVQADAFKVGLSVRVQQASNVFSVGGSLGTNVHGQDHLAGTLVNTVRRIGLASAWPRSGGGAGRSSWLTLENPTVFGAAAAPGGTGSPAADRAELFNLVVGGFGLFGVVGWAELQLVENCYVKNVGPEEDIQLKDYLDKELPKILPPLADVEDGGDEARPGTGGEKMQEARVVVEEPNVRIASGSLSLDHISNDGADFLERMIYWKVEEVLDTEAVAALEAANEKAERNSIKPTFLSERMPIGAFKMILGFPAFRRVHAFRDYMFRNAISMREPILRTNFFIQSTQIHFWFHESFAESEWLLEIHLPCGNAWKFVKESLKPILRKQVVRAAGHRDGIYLLNVGMRHIPYTEAESARVLTYARGGGGGGGKASVSKTRQHTCSIVLCWVQKMTETAITNTQDWVRETYEAATAEEIGGSFYLPYHPFARREHLLKAYPRLSEFLDLQKKYDPKAIFANTGFYAHLKNAADDRGTAAGAT